MCFLKLEFEYEIRKMNTLKYVTYCGLYCKLCAQMGRIPQQARSLRETMAKEGYEFFGPLTPNFPDFWKFLDRLSRSDETGPGCRGGCGYPECKIRKCARERGIDLCSSCPEYPCPHIQQLAKRYPTLIADGMRQREIGVDRWIAEQEDRCTSGFVYADIRVNLDVIDSERQGEVPPSQCV